MNFEWQTGEESDSGQSDQWLPEPGLRSRPRRLWILLPLALVVAAIIVTGRQLNERVEEATSLVRGDVLSSHALARRAAAQQDEDLFVSILSGRGGRWRDVQQERLHNGLLFEDTLRPLGFIPLSGPAQNIAVLLNPELSEAVVQEVQSFTVDAGRGLTATIHLTQTHVYRRGEQRWLLSQPGDAFWGAWQTVDGDLLTVVAPERERELAARLARDIDDKLSEMCREIVTCPQEFHVRLRLEKDPSSVIQAAEAVRSLGADRTVILPAPTLLGLPVDGTGYDALYRAYARHVVAAAIMSITEYECCNGILFYRALLEMQLAQVDLRSPPLQDGAYRHLLDVPTSARHLEDLWESGELPAEEQSIPLEVYTLVQFLQQRSGGSADSLYRRQHSFDSTIWEWLREQEWGLVRTLFEDRWKTFVQDRISEGQEAARRRQELDLPQQDLVAICGNELQDVYRYDLHDEQWSVEAEVGLEFGLLGTLAGSDSYIVTGQLPAAGEEPRYTTLLMRSQVEPITLAGEERSGPVLVPWNIAEPSGRRMVVQILGSAGISDWDPEADLLAWILQSARGTSRNPQVALLDPDSCGEQGCAFEALPGIPLWSSDGSQKLTVELFLDGMDGFDGLKIHYGPDGLQQRLTTNTIWPFWLDNETFGFGGAGSRGPRHPVVNITNVRTGETSVLLTSEDALRAIPEERQPATLPPTVQFRALLAHPSDPNSLLALVTPHVAHGERFLLEVRRPHEQEAWIDVEPEVALLQGFTDLIQEDWRRIVYSLNDRWLNLEVQAHTGEEGPRLLIFDLLEGRLVLDSAAPADNEVPGQRGDWSADGVWFARSLPERIDLIAPGIAADGRPARHVIFHEFGQCTSVGWMNG